MADVFFKSDTNSYFEETFDHNSMTLYLNCCNILGTHFLLTIKFFLTVEFLGEKFNIL